MPKSKKNNKKILKCDFCPNSATAYTYFSDGKVDNNYCDCCSEEFGMVLAKKQEIIKTLGKFDGWRNIRFPDDAPQEAHGEKKPTRGFQRLPDYLYDLNAIYKLERELVDRDDKYKTLIIRYYTNLKDILGIGTVYHNIPDIFALANANCQIRAQALYETIIDEELV